MGSDKDKRKSSSSDSSDSSDAAPADLRPKGPSPAALLSGELDVMKPARSSGGRHAQGKRRPDHARSGRSSRTVDADESAVVEPVKPLKSALRSSGTGAAASHAALGKEEEAEAEIADEPIYGMPVVPARVRALRAQQMGGPAPGLGGGPSTGRMLAPSAGVSFAAGLGRESMVRADGFGSAVPTPRADISRHASRARFGYSVRAIAGTGKGPETAGSKAETAGPSGTAVPMNTIKEDSDDSDSDSDSKEDEERKYAELARKQQYGIGHRIFKIIFSVLMLGVLLALLLVADWGMLFYVNRASPEAGSVELLPAEVVFDNNTGSNVTLPAVLASDVCGRVSDAVLPLRFSLGCYSERLWIALFVVGTIPSMWLIISSAFMANAREKQARPDDPTVLHWRGRRPALTLPAMGLISIFEGVLEAAGLTLFLFAVIPFVDIVTIAVGAFATIAIPALSCVVANVVIALYRVRMKRGVGSGSDAQMAQTVDDLPPVSVIGLVVNLIALIVALAAIIMIPSTLPSSTPDHVNWAFPLAVIGCSVGGWRVPQHLFTQPLRIAMDRHHYATSVIRHIAKLLVVVIGAYIAAAAFELEGNPFAKARDAMLLDSGKNFTGEFADGAFGSNLTSTIRYNTGEQLQLVVEIPGNFSDTGLFTNSLFERTINLKGGDTVEWAEDRAWDMVPALSAVIAAFLSASVASQLLRAALARMVSIAFIFGTALVIVLGYLVGNVSVAASDANEYSAWLAEFIADPRTLYGAGLDTTALVLLILTAACWFGISAMWRAIDNRSSNGLDKDMWFRPGGYDLFPLLPGVPLAIMRNWHPTTRSGGVGAHRGGAAPGDHFTFIVATLFRENETEMRNLMRSVAELNAHCNEDERDRYRMYIMFDGALGKPVERSPDARYPDVLGDFAIQFLDILAEFGGPNAVDEMQFNTDPAIGSLVCDFVLKHEAPDNSGINSLAVTVVFKDPAVVKRRKRWSQILYASCIINEIVETESLLERLDNNVFLLLLDGDTSFPKSAVDLLHETIAVDPERTGAVCGRIIPVGEANVVSPMVWFQQFEYAAGHWLVKAAEDVFGTVLCAPGCFTLCRFSALLRKSGDGNLTRIGESVIECYGREVEEAAHVLMYDQGEDRMLSSLLVKNGWRIGYSADAIAKTFCPSNFNDFFVQRRRWITSTLANQLQLLAWSGEILRTNRSFSSAYLAFVAASLVASLLGPATILLLTQGAFAVAFQTDAVVSTLIAFLVPIIYVFILATFWYDNVKPDSGMAKKRKIEMQIKTAALMTTFYALVMCAVVVSVSVRIADDIGENGVPVGPDTWFLTLLSALFILAACLHGDFGVLVTGVVYLLLVPMGHLLVVAFGIANTHDQSWGTREGASEDKEVTLASVANLRWLACIPYSFRWLWKRFRGHRVRRAEPGQHGYAIVASDEEIDAAIALESSEGEGDDDAANDGDDDSSSSSDSSSSESDDDKKKKGKGKKGKDGKGKDGKGKEEKPLLGASPPPRRAPRGLPPAASARLATSTPPEATMVQPRAMARQKTVGFTPSTEEYPVNRGRGMERGKSVVLAGHAPEGAQYAMTANLARQAAAERKRTLHHGLLAERAREARLLDDIRALDRPSHTGPPGSAPPSTTTPIARTATLRDLPALAAPPGAASTRLMSIHNQKSVYGQYDPNFDGPATGEDDTPAGKHTRKDKKDSKKGRKGKGRRGKKGRRGADSSSSDDDGLDRVITAAEAEMVAKKDHLRVVMARLLLMVQPVETHPDVVREQSEALAGLSKSFAGVFLFASVMWIVLAIAFSFQANLQILSTSFTGFVFLVVFGILLFVEFLALIAHRWTSLLHHVAVVPMSSGKPLVLVDPGSGDFEGHYMSFEGVEAHQH